MGFRDTTDEQRSTRRSFLRSFGATGSVPLIGGIGIYGQRRSPDDTDDDGIPDSKKRSASFHRRLEDLFGAEQFEGLERGRRDLLLDVRYLGPTRTFLPTRRTIVGRFRNNGIYAQWLDYPQRYDVDAVDEQYGLTVEGLLLGRDSFYAELIEPTLKDVALQLFVVPGAEPPHEDRIYSRSLDVLGGGTDGYINGFSAGNRAVVVERHDRFDEARLVLHELTHLSLCHDDDPANTGVMGSGEEIDVMDDEWAQLRNDLENVRDDTGYDFVMRPCLWYEQAAGLFD